MLKGGYQFFGDLMNSIKSISSSGGKQINKQTKTLNISAATRTIDTAQANDFENFKLCYLVLFKDHTGFFSSLTRHSLSHISLCI